MQFFQTFGLDQSQWIILFITALTIGTVASFLSGLAALWLLFGVVRRGWFGHFGWYCLAVGVAALAFG